MCVKCAVIVFREFDFSMCRMTDVLVLGFRSREDLYNASCVLILDVHAAGYERKPTFIVAAATNKSKVTVVPCYLL